MKTGVGIILLPTNLQGIWMSMRTEPGHRLNGYWQIPGGKPKRGESPACAALRELLEETDIRLFSHRELTQASSCITEYEDGEKFQSITYLHITDSVPKNMEVGKHTPWQLVPLERIPYLKIFGGLKHLFKEPKPALICPNCQSQRLKRCQPTKQSSTCPALRCLDCSVKFIITNQSYLRSGSLKGIK